MRTALRRASVPAIARGIAVAGALACGREPPRAHRVVIQNFAITPASVVAAPGDTIVWENADIVPHTATARDSTWDSKSIDAGGTWRVVVRAPGRHAYFCVFHPNMQATVEVR